MPKEFLKNKKRRVIIIGEVSNGHATLLTSKSGDGNVRGSNPTLSATQNQYGGIAQLGELEWHSRGQEFEPPLSPPCNNHKVL